MKYNWGVEMRNLYRIVFGKRLGNGDSRDRKGWRPGFDPGSVDLGFVVEKVALGQVFPRVLRFFLGKFIPPVLHYKEKRKKLIIFITGLHNKP
jgi:hypothetical protein